MSYTAPNGPLMPRRHSIDSGEHIGVLTAWGAAGAAWPSANLAIYIPVVVPSTVVVTSLWFATTATGATGNYDIGLYNSAGTRLLARGSTAKPATSSQVVWDCTNTTIGPGVYYVALASNSGTDTFTRAAPAAPIAAAAGVLSESSAFPLPATATWATAQTLTYLPLCGILLNTIVT